jgi:hypothetical protein
VVLYGCEIWSLTLRQEHTLRGFDDKMLRRIFGPKRDEVAEGLRKLHRQKLHNFKEDEMDRASSRMRRRGIHIGYWWESKKERDHLIDQDVGGRIELKWILEIG